MPSVFNSSITFSIVMLASWFSRFNTRTRSPSGRQIASRLGPQSTNVGRPSAEAICVTPESCPTKPQHLAKRLAKCCGFVGHDSGVTHIASALGLPTLVLWGPSREAIWRPLGERVRVLNRENQLANITIENVIEELNTLGMESG